MTSGTQARASGRGLISAALVGSGCGLALGASYMAAGMAQAVADHGRVVRIAEAAQGAFSETMLQREMNRMDPAALRLARAYDSLAADSARDPAQAWPVQMEDQQVAGRHGTALDSARQLDCLTQAVYFEARGETPRGQAAVAQVVLNRVNNPSFPKTVCGVVFQGAATHGCQFSFACDGSMRHGLETGAWDRARRIAERALSGVVLADIGKATYFHTTTVQPDWGPQMLRVAQVGLHVFYRFSPHAPISHPALEQRAVFVKLPMAPGGNIRLAAAMPQKTADATVSAAGLAPADSKAPAAKPGKPVNPPVADSKGLEPVNPSEPTDAEDDAAAS